MLTRRPSPRRVSPAAAALLIDDAFPATRHLDAAAAGAALSEFAELGIDDGAVYDALVGATARQHGLPLLTRDARAERVYRLLGVHSVLL